MRTGIFSHTFCVFDEAGIVISASPTYARMLKRPEALVVGHHWKEWARPCDYERVEAVFAKISSGERCSLVRPFIRNDGSAINLVVSGQSFSLANRHVSIGTYDIVDKQAGRLSPQSLEVAEYVSELTEELSRMAASHGLANLERLLQEAHFKAHSMAEGVEKLLFGDTGVRH